jgi:hypothetical protein
MEVAQLVIDLRERGAFDLIANNPLSQFGTPARPYLGAELLPEKPVKENHGVIRGMRWRPLMARASTRYQPVQKSRSMVLGAYNWMLGESDHGDDFTSEDYDAFLELVSEANFAGDKPSMQAMALLINWFENSINRPLLERNEWDRWQAIVNATVTQHGNDNFVNTITYPNPSGTRVSAGGTWSNNSYDIFTDLTAAKNFMRAKGYTLKRIITGFDVVSIMQNNTLMKQRGGIISLISGSIIGQPGSLSDMQLATVLTQAGLPMVEQYDLQYYTEATTGYFLPRGTMVMVAATGRNKEIDRADLEPITVFDTLGYTGIGRSAGQNVPGKVLKPRVIDDEKPPRIEGRAWQTSAPVIEDPEAFFVISGIA